MNKEVWRYLREPVNPKEVYKMLQMVDASGADCDYFQNICIEYLLGMINDLRDRVNELEKRTTDNRTDK